MSGARPYTLKDGLAWLCTKSVFAEHISHAKAQRRKALPRFSRFSLRLCAFAREIFLPPMCPESFVQSRLASKEAHSQEVKNCAKK
jgi:hypothetical protein